MFRIFLDAVMILGLFNSLIVYPYQQSYSPQRKDADNRRTTTGQGKGEFEENSVVSRTLEDKRKMASSRSKSDRFNSVREKRGIQNDECDLFRADFKCNDTKRSCQNRCGDIVTTENATSFYCHCDDLCTHYGDCCKDFARLCRGCNASERDFEINRTRYDGGNTTCAPPPVQKTKRSNYQCTRVQGVSVYLKAKCHADFRNTDLEKKCLQPGEPYSNIPCYDIAKGIHYKNIFCARCDYVSNTTSVFWRVKISCLKGYFYDNFKHGNVNNFHLIKLIQDSKPRGRGCTVEYLEPLRKAKESIRNPLRPCIAALYECNFCGERKLETLCHAQGLDPVVKGVIYHNFYCWKCNQYRKQQLPTCNLAVFFDRNIINDVMMFSFQMLVDSTDNKINVKTVADKTHTKITEMALACSENQVQCQLKKCYGNYKLVGDACVIVDILVNVEIVCKVLRSDSTNFILYYVESQIYELFLPLGAVLPTKYYTDKDRKLTTARFEYDVVFEDSPNVLEMINNSMAEKMEKLGENLNELLLSRNLSAHSVSITSIEYNIASKPTKTKESVMSKGITPLTTNAEVTRAAENSAGIMAGSFTLSILIWSFNILMDINQ